MSSNKVQDLTLMDTSSPSSRVEQISNGLSKYYSSQGQEYNHRFSNFCDENGIDDDVLHEELHEDPTQSTIIECFINNNESNNGNDYNFPFPSNQQLCKQDQAKFIMHILKKCDEKKHITFSNTLPTINREFFNITKKDLESVRDIYKQQCPVFYNTQFKYDTTFLQMLAVCRHHNVPYLQLLIDDYSRDRIKNIDKVWTIEDWMSNHKHFKALQRIKLPAMPTFDGDVNINKPQTGRNTLKTAADFVKQAITLHPKRFNAKLTFKPFYLINDSLEIIIKCIYCGFILTSNLQTLKTNKDCTLTRYQFDLCIVTKPSFDEDDNQHDEGDFIGDIEKKLKNNNLEYYKENMDFNMEKDDEIFTRFYQKFESKYDNDISSENSHFLQNKRIICMVDRRKLKEGNAVYMYFPPKGNFTRDIPQNAVNEWHFASSRTCLLPNYEYKEAVDVGNGDEMEDKLRYKSIDTNSSCNGSLLTLSFHVNPESGINVYLYHSAGITRMYPDDIKSALPKLFNMDYEKNEQYLKQNLNELDEMIEEMSILTKNEYFDAFRDHISLNQFVPTVIEQDDDEIKSYQDDESDEEYPENDDYNIIVENEDACQSLKAHKLSYSISDDPKIWEALQYYQQYNGKEILNKKEFVDICNAKYKTILNEYVNMIPEEGNETKNDNTDMMMKCSISPCNILQRHHRDNNKDDGNKGDVEFRYWRNLLDSMHCYLLHRGNFTFFTRKRAERFNIYKYLQFNMDDDFVNCYK